MQTGLNKRNELPCRPNAFLSTDAARARSVSISKRIAAGSDALESVPEFELFAAMNTCAYHVNRAVDSGSGDRRASNSWRNRWKTIRDFLIENNLGLVYSMVARLWRGQSDWEDARSAALLALVRAVEGFDPWRGVRFSTYACTAIRRALICVGRASQTYRIRFRTNQDEVPIEHAEQEDVWQTLFVDRLQRVLEDNLCDLSKRELDILEWRFPSSGVRPRTLSDIGRSVGVSKERVRQLEKSALLKLRAALDADPSLQ